MPRAYQLLEPGQDPTQMNIATPPRTLGTIMSGPLWLLVIVGAVGLLCRGTVFATPAPTPTLPALLELPTATPTMTVTATLTATTTGTPTMTVTATDTPTPTLTVTPTTTPSSTPTVTPLPWIDGIVINARQLNMRFGPGQDYPVADRINQDDAVRIVARDQGATWGQLDSGLWVRMHYVSTTESIARLPVEDGPG